MEKLQVTSPKLQTNPKQKTFNRLLGVLNFPKRNLFGNWKLAIARWARPFREIGNLQNGFTLVELIVVVAVAALVLSGTVAAFQTARMRGRDATREQHMKALQAALSLYANTAGSYPVYEGALTGSDVVSVELKGQETVSDIPHDPLDGGNYRYQYISTDGATYLLRYYLETGSVSGKSAGVQEVRP